MDPNPKYTPIPNAKEVDGLLLGSIFFEENIRQLKDFELEAEDVLMCGYPKSGTTWLQEIVWLLHNDIDTEVANQQSVWLRIPLVESAPPKEESGLEIVRKQPHPRLIKTHMPLRYWKRQIDESKPKVLYMMRNVKDVLVSFYHFIQMGHGHKCCTFDQFFDNVRCGKCLYGDWFEQIKEYWTAFKDDPNVMFIKYENMKKDPRGSIIKVAEFLGKDLSQKEIEKLLVHTSFKNMKSNPATNMQQHEYLKPKEGESFQRKGAIGDWANTLSTEQSEWLDARFQDTFEGTGLTFEYD